MKLFIHYTFIMPGIGRDTIKNTVQKLKIIDQICPCVVGYWENLKVSEKGKTDEIHLQIYHTTDTPHNALKMCESRLLDAQHILRKNGFWGNFSIQFIGFTINNIIEIYSYMHYAMSRFVMGKSFGTVKTDKFSDKSIYSFSKGQELKEVHILSTYNLEHMMKMVNNRRFAALIDKNYTTKRAKKNLDKFIAECRNPEFPKILNIHMALYNDINLEKEVKKLLYTWDEFIEKTPNKMKQNIAAISIHIHTDLVNKWIGVDLRKELRKKHVLLATHQILEGLAEYVISEYKGELFKNIFPAGVREEIEINDIAIIEHYNKNPFYYDDYPEDKNHFMCKDFGLQYSEKFVFDRYQLLISYVDAFVSPDKPKTISKINLLVYKGFLKLFPDQTSQ